MQRGILCLHSVSEADMGIRDLASSVVLEVRFTLEVGGQLSTGKVALVEQVGDRLQDSRIGDRATHRGPTTHAPA